MNVNGEEELVVARLGRRAIGELPYFGRCEEVAAQGREAVVVARLEVVSPRVDEGGGLLTGKLLNLGF